MTFELFMGRLYILHIARGLATHFGRVGAAVVGCVTRCAKEAHATQLPAPPVYIPVTLVAQGEERWRYRGGIVAVLNWLIQQREMRLARQRPAERPRNMRDARILWFATFHLMTVYSKRVTLQIAMGVTPARLKC